jgi:uncharacterized protein
MAASGLIQVILEQYALAWDGVHGVTHWARVLENGRRLAGLTGAKLEVVELFAVLHDAKRRNEGIDFVHGPEGAEYAASLKGTLIQLSDLDFELLYQACAEHTDGHTLADVTVQTCWDADRLDLGRVGITPRPNRLCTDAARNPEVLEWAKQRARTRFVPELVLSEWGIDLDQDGSRHARHKFF